MKIYKQCRLQRGDEYTTGWIETRGAGVGRIVKMVGDDLPWQVIDVADVPMLREDQLKEHQQLNRKSFASTEPIR